MHSPMFSLEVFHPKRNAPVDTIYDTLDGLEGLNPDFISVTYGHGTHSDHPATTRRIWRNVEPLFLGTQG